MLELYQAEWCPHSHKVRQRLTELGVAFVARQVPAKPSDRSDLEHVAGTNEIPVLLTEEGSPVAGEDPILEFLADGYEERPDARDHRQKVEEKLSFET